MEIIYIGGEIILLKLSPELKKMKSKNRHHFVSDIQRGFFFFFNGKQICSALEKELKFGDWKMAIEHKRKDLGNRRLNCVPHLPNSYVEGLSPQNVPAFEDRSL